MAKQNYSNFVLPHIYVKEGKAQPSINYGYGTYDDLDLAYAAIIEDFGEDDNIPFALTVGIKNSDNTLTEYYWNGSEFTPKTAEGGGGGGGIDNALVSAAKTFALSNSSPTAKLVFTDHNGAQTILDLPIANVVHSNVVSYYYGGLLTQKDYTRLQMSWHIDGELDSIKQLPAASVKYLGKMFKMKDNNSVWVCIKETSPDYYHWIIEWRTGYNKYIDGYIESGEVINMNDVIAQFGSSSGEYTINVPQEGAYYGKLIKSGSKNYLCCCDASGNVINSGSPYVWAFKDSNAMLLTYVSINAMTSTDYIANVAYVSREDSVVYRWMYLFTCDTALKGGEYIIMFDNLGDGYNKILENGNSDGSVTHKWEYDSEKDALRSTNHLKDGDAEGTSYDSTIAKIEIQAFKNTKMKITFGQKSERSYDYCTILDSSGNQLYSFKGIYTDKDTCTINAVSDGILDFRYSKDTSQSQDDDSFWLYSIEKVD